MVNKDTFVSFKGAIAPTVPFGSALGWWKFSTGR